MYFLKGLKFALSIINFQSILICFRFLDGAFFLKSVLSKR